MALLLGGLWQSSTSWWQSLRRKTFTCGQDVKEPMRNQLGSHCCLQWPEDFPHGSTSYRFHNLPTASQAGDEAINAHPNHSTPQKQKLLTKVWVPLVYLGLWSQDAEMRARGKNWGRGIAVIELDALLSCLAFCKTGHWILPIWHTGVIHQGRREKMQIY